MATPVGVGIVKLSVCQLASRRDVQSKEQTYARLVDVLGTVESTKDAQTENLTDTVVLSTRWPRYTFERIGPGNAAP
jgi:hypothetical protein